MLYEHPTRLAIQTILPGPLATGTLKALLKGTKLKDLRPLRSVYTGGPACATCKRRVSRGCGTGVSHPLFEGI